MADASNKQFLLTLNSDIAGADEQGNGTLLVAPALADQINGRLHLLAVLVLLLLAFSVYMARKAGVV